MLIVVLLVLLPVPGKALCRDLGRLALGCRLHTDTSTQGWFLCQIFQRSTRVLTLHIDTTVCVFKRLQLHGMANFPRPYLAACFLYTSAVLQTNLGVVQSVYKEVDRLQCSAYITTSNNMKLKIILKILL